MSNSKRKAVRQVEVWINAGEKAISLSPCDPSETVDIRVNVAAGVAPWFATNILGKVDPAGKATKSIRWTVDVETLPEHTSATTGKVVRILDLRNPETFKSWVREVKALAKVRGTASDETAKMLAELSDEFGIGDDNTDDPFS